MIRTPIAKLFDRPPPTAIEAEMSLLGSMILDPKVIPDVVEKIAGPEVFYEGRHGLIFQAIAGLHDRRQALDLVQLNQSLADRGVLEQIGGTDYLVKLASETPTTANWSHHADMVTSKHQMRKLIDASSQTLHDAYHATDEQLPELMDIAEQRILEVAQSSKAEEPQELAHLVAAEYQRMMATDEGRSPVASVRTGYYELDTMLCGLHAGEFVIVAARPSIGKTALMLNLAEQIAFGTSGPDNRAEREPVSVGVMSLEMSRDALAQRLISSNSGINSHKIRAATLQDSEWETVSQACSRLGNAPVYIDDTASLTVLQLRNKARRMMQRHKIGALVIDYIQLLTSPQQSRENRQVEVSAISRGIKALARELKIPVVALSQLNRGPEGREGNRPRLSDLRESGSLEQDADVVLLLHREAYYHIGDAEWHLANPDGETRAELIVAKQRNGPTGTVHLNWNAATTRFLNSMGGRP